MNCSDCGSEIVEGSVFCSQCGSKIPGPASRPTAPDTATIASGAAPAVAFEPAPIASVPTSGNETFDAWHLFRLASGLIFTGIVAITITRPESYGWSYFAGTWFGTALIPIVISLLFWAFKHPKRSYEIASKAFFWSCLGVMFLHGNSLQQNSKPNYNGNEWTGILMQQAAGTLPANNDRSPFPSEFNDLLRTMFREVITATRESHQAIDKASTSSANLYEPSSFSTSNSIQNAENWISDLLEADSQLNQRVDNAVERMHQSLIASSIPNKEGLWNDFSEGYRSSMQMKKNVYAIERLWVAATIDLYEYAGKHSDVIYVREDHLYITDERVRAEFNAKTTRCNALRENFLKAYDYFNSSREGMFKRSGVNPKDVGLD